MLILKHIVFIARIADINQMIGNRLPIHDIIRQVFSRSNIHPSVKLPGIGTDDLRIQSSSQGSRQSRLAGSRRPQYRNQFILIHTANLHNLRRFSIPTMGEKQKKPHPEGCGPLYNLYYLLIMRLQMPCERSNREPC